MGKTGRECTICSSDKRHVVEIGLAYGLSYQSLADRYDLSKDAIGRHAREHLTPQVRAALLAAQAPTDIDLDKLRQSESEGLLGHLVAQRARLLQVSQIALEVGDVKAMVAAEGAIGANLALGAKLLGHLVNRIDVRHSSVLLTPDYLRLRQAMLGALRAFPEAARAVGEALARLESDAARDITDEATKGKAPRVIEHEPAAPKPLPPPPC
jgi:hypothetical protein